MTPAYNFIPTMGVGDPYPSSTNNKMRDNFAFLHRPPGCRVRRHVTPQTTPGDSTHTPVEFNEADLRDTDAFHSPGSDPSKVTVPTGLGGIYRCTAFVEFAPNNTGTRLGGFRVNGSVYYWGYTQVAPTFYEARNTMSAEIALIEGDYLELIVLQNSTSDVDVTDARMTVTWVAANDV